MENMEKRPPSTPKEIEQDEIAEACYQAAYESAIAQGIIDESVSPEEYRKMNFYDLLKRLKEKDIDSLEIRLKV